MTDYGHDLIFGTFITPQNQRPQDVVGLARLTERAGLDLVTFMDHPYQPALLDTWTLLSYVAARTERVRLSGYVLNLPSRPPAVLARAAEHLRLICGELQMADVRQQVALSLLTEFENFSVFKPREYNTAALHTMLDQVVAWSTALAPLRTATAA